MLMTSAASTAGISTSTAASGACLSEAQSAEEEISRLLALERRNLTAARVARDCPSLRFALDGPYMSVRGGVSETMATIALGMDIKWQTVATGLAWVDMYRLKTVHTRRMKIHLVAIAALSLATKYWTPFAIDLEELAEAWCRHVGKVYPDSAEVEFYPESSEVVVFTKKQVSMAEFCLMRELEWLTGAATSDRFLDAFIARGLQGAGDTIGGVAVSPEQWLGVCAMAQQFVEHCGLHGQTCFYGESIAAVACIAAARSIAGIEPCWSEELEARTGVHAAADVELCVRDIAAAHYSRQHGMTLASPVGSPRGVGRTPDT